MNKKLIIVKFGGGLIAPKDWNEETVDTPTLKRLCQEIFAVWKKGETNLLIVSGSGNFGHMAVKKFGISTKIGVAKVQRSARKIGQIVTTSLLSEKVPARIVVPHELWPDGDVKIVLEMLASGTVPVFYGDVIWEENLATIYSGEKCISKLVPILIKSQWYVEKIIYVGVEDGVWDQNRQIVLEINSQNWGQVKKDVGKATGVDVTGGMLHKVEESLLIHEKFEIESFIINGGKKQFLEKALCGEKVLGSVIK